MEKAEIVLREYLDTVLDGLNYKPRDVFVKPISSGGANFTSGLFKIAVSSPNKEKLHLFSKVAIVADAMREKFMCAELFAQERLAYEDLQKSYESIQTKYGIPEKDRFIFAKYYGSDLNPGCEVFILEDLNERGFQIYNRFDALNWDHVSENIKVLAKFHALSMALEKENPEVFEKFTKNSFPIDGMLDFYRDYTENLMEGLSENHKNVIRNFLKNVGGLNLITNHYKPYGKDIIVHSDFRPSNIMYKQEGSNITVIPVDFQVVRVGCAVSDLLYFVLTATDGALRQTHFERLLDLYHSELASRLAALDIDVDDVYPRKQFDKELKKMLPAMLPMSMLMLPALFVAEDDAPRVSDPAVTAADYVVRPTPQATARLNDVIEDFIRWKLL